MCGYARLIAAPHSRWRPNAGDRSISLLGFRARRCSFSGTVAEPCAWESRCSLDSLRRTVGSGFHLNDHVMHFVGLCVLLPLLSGSGHCESSSSCHSSYFCELELLCDRDARVADAVALPRDSDNGTSSSSSDRKSSGLSRRHLPQSRLSHNSSWVSSHSLSFPLAASESTIGGLSAA